jgi:UDP:flavonoid glycosyltransferase YjiC (YdhE family)
VKFLFCCLSTPGYVNPAIGLALSLRERGHEAAFVTDISCTERISRQGLRRIPLGHADGPSFQADRWFDAPSVALQMKHISYALNEFHADVLVGQQFTFGPLLVGQHRRIPVAVIGLFCYLWPASQARRDAALAPTEAARIWRHEEMLGSYNKVRTLLGFRPVTSDGYDSPLLGDAFLLRSIPEIQDMDHLPARVHLVGDCLWEDVGPDPELDDWLSDAISSGSRIVYVHHGREFSNPNSSFWPSVAALADLNVRVAASIGRMDYKPKDWPKTFFVRDYVPQGRVLSRASAMIGTANTTVVLGALTSNVPCLFMSRNSGEEPEVAQVCTRAGVAKTLSADAWDRELGQELALMLENIRMQQAAKRIALAFREFSGRRQAANLLQELAKSRGPLSRTLAAHAGQVVL